MRLDCAGKVVDLSQPQIMGILNVTSDSFSDGGRYTAVDAAVAHALQMQADGAAVIDVGGESTRPGSAGVSVDEELARVLPVIEALVAAPLDIPISIDTSKPEVMRRAVQAGVGLLNDVNALLAPGAVALAAELQLPVCLMHRQGGSATMQDNPKYVDVVEEVGSFLNERAAHCRSAGVQQIILDPGFGFGKSYTHNQLLFRALDAWQAQVQAEGMATLIGVSRKRMVSEALGDVSIADRVVGSAVLAALAAKAGASIVRVHDVAATRSAMRVMDAFT